MSPTPRTDRLVMGDFSRPDGARHPRHPRGYEIADPEEAAEVRDARSHRPADPAVLERRLLRAPEDRIRRS
ncbi:hypothetical protein ACFWFZ_18455 [Streptomyces sp. NPDC060232]|uniref:hypothetical protein n=1 Tax=Streptomyces sp. NPDC060232 TaxID=3347079 RepID=UPI0036549FEA